MLNSNSPIPLYQQLADRIQAAVLDGNYAVGEKIPSEHQMAATYQVGRPTVRQATDLLVRKRVLQRRRGSGTYVLPETKQVDLFSLVGTSAAFAQLGVDVSSRFLQPVRQVQLPCDHPSPFCGGDAFHLSRLSQVDNAPVLLEEIYLHTGLFHGLEKHDLGQCSLSELARDEYFMKPQSADQQFRIVYPNRDQMEALELSENDPVLKVERLIHFPQSRDAIYAELYCRTDHFVFSQTITSPMETP